MLGDPPPPPPPLPADQMQKLECGVRHFVFCAPLALPFFAGYGPGSLCVLMVGCR